MHKFYTFLGVALGLSFISIFLYFRLLLDRLPTLIFFNVTIFTLIFYIFIIVFNVWNIGFGELILDYYKNHYKIKPSKFRLKLKNIWLFLIKPLFLVYDNLIKNRKYFEWIAQKITIGTNKIFLKYRLITILLDLIPRFCVVFALFLDIQIGIFYYFYCSLALYLIPLLYTLLLKMTQQVNFKYLKLYNETYFFTWVFNLNFDALIRCLTKKLYFTYNPKIPKNERDKQEFGQVANIYIGAIFQSILLKAKEDYILIFFHRLIHLIFALEWWYILFHILLKMPSIQWNFIYIGLYNFFNLLFDYPLEILF